MLADFLTPIQHWIAIHTGIEYAGPDKYYNAWSGILSDIGEITILAGVIGLFRQHNCHQHGCWRLGKHTTRDGHKLCKIHVSMSKDDLTLHEVHPDHAAR